jgi:hypothetical protein
VTSHDGGIDVPEKSRRCQPVGRATIVQARYGGAYEGAEFVALPLLLSDVPAEVQGDDLSCAGFFRHPPVVLGIGDTPNDAYNDLIDKILECEHPEQHQDPEPPYGPRCLYCRQRLDAEETERLVDELFESVARHGLRLADDAERVLLGVIEGAGHQVIGEPVWVGVWNGRTHIAVGCSDGEGPKTAVVEVGGHHLRTELVERLAARVTEDAWLESMASEGFGPPWLLHLYGSAPSRWEEIEAAATGAGITLLAPSYSWLEGGDGERDDASATGRERRIADLLEPEAEVSERQADTPAGEPAAYDLLVDFMRMDDDGTLTARAEDLRPGLRVNIGDVIVVGSEDAIPAEAQVVRLDISGLIGLRVLDVGRRHGHEDDPETDDAVIAQINRALAAASIEEEPW